ncbi:MAG: GAF domain-containing protein [Gemmatimonadota bacterium]|nr:MAG: GAF domain-containing protein [Gemmatimonadota bacterium]
MKNATRTQEDRLRALVEVSRAVSASLAHEEILAQICTHAARLLNAESAVMTEMCHDCGPDPRPCLKVVATSPDASIGLGEFLSMKGSLNGIAITERRTFLINDVMSDERADRVMAAKLGVLQEVISPLYYGDEPLGTIFAFNSTQERDFTEADAEILEALAAQAAIALHNAHIFETEQRRLEELTALRAAQDDNMRRLQALIRAGMALNSRLSLDEVLQTLVDSAREVIKARYAALGVLDSSGKSLARFLHSAIDPQTVIRIGRWPTGGGTLGIMLRDSQTVRLRDVQQHKDFAGFPEGHPSMRSLLGVPIRIGNRVFGNLYLTEKIEADGFSAEDEELAELLAAQAAVAVENAQLAEQRGQFLAIVNHEIKNAAAGVVGWTDRLRKLTGHGDERLREGASYASEGAQQLHRLVVDLLDLSRIEARQLELDFRGADLRALIREVVATVRPTAERQEIELRVSGLDKRTIVQTDGTRVRQILLNLLSNALKFTKSGGQVDLELAPFHKGWAITVSDTGPGVDPAVGERVFEAYRAGTFKVPQAGAGLGLAISRELARLLGGELSHVDGAGVGARFRLWLPSQPPAAAQHDTQS